ncbi:unnamed protein product [Zymoseptoria tritici ST99CH_3D7]|uniref:SprT-like domain-containing protein n=1 Tax=Zymoseptoria tritici (strain ST99CH_3D7) TaxID=1276538 RepID=A0A1X7RCE0_ZYMT9|nr:unnamed protein product [Zymoseptoria tritici ST99CH_3D7]
MASMQEIEAAGAAARAKWPQIKRTKVLEPLSILRASRTAWRNGETFARVCDVKATEATIEWMNGTWSEERLAAWELWREEYLPKLCEAAQNGTLEELHHAEEGMRSFMQQVVQCLDVIFFGGRLAPYCTFKFEALDGALGEMRPTSHGIRIAVDLARSPSLLRMIGTILHELCHTHDQILGCRCGSRCRQCVDDGEYLGRIAHPECFFDLSLQVENLASLLHGTKIDLGRAKAFTNTLCDLGTYTYRTTVREQFTRAEDLRRVAKFAGFDDILAELKETEASRSDSDSEEDELPDLRLQLASASDVARASRPFPRTQ